MTQTHSARPIRPRRWFATVWAMPVLLAALSAGMHYLEGGAFDAAWTGRTLLLAAVPLLMADRLAMLNSARVRRIMGRRFRYFAGATLALFYAQGCILLMIDGDDSRIALQMTIWMIAAVVFGAVLSGRQSRLQSARSPDLADRYIDLDDLEYGNWFMRTGQYWGPPVGVGIFLAFAWANGADDDPGFTQWLMVLLLSIGGERCLRPWHRNPFAMSYALGFGLLFYALLFT
jgi:hypothetical protein